MGISFADIASLSFKMDEAWVEKYKGTQPEWGPIGYITYKRTYARTLDDGTTEEWWQTCKRVVEGTFSIQKNHCNLNRLPWNEEKAQRTSKKMFQAMWDFKFLPPGRGLWAMGTAHIAKAGGMALNNCAFVSTEGDFVSAIGFAMDCLMLGVGVGFDTLGAYKFPHRLATPYSRATQYTHIIEDTREAWVESVCSLVEHYIDSTPYPVFDYSKVRPEGQPIKGFGGISSGPDPLIKLHKSIDELFANKNYASTLSSSDIVDIMNMIGKCVVAGNVRRSAELAIGCSDDMSFIQLKTDKEKLYSHRWASNNSISVEPGSDYTVPVSFTQINGEPGYIWLENMRQYGRMKDGARNADPRVKGANPCVEQCLESYELCCLVETFPARHDSLASYMDTLKLAYLYAKTVTLVPTHHEKANSVMLKNRRIGCSQSGIVRAFNKHGRHTMLTWCDKSYDFIKSLDKQYSQWLCVPESIKKTSVKPSGTVSLLPGETPGIHYPISRYYIRRIRFAKNSEWVPLLSAAGYHTEPDVTQPDSSVVVSFPVQEKDFIKSEAEASMWEQLINVSLYQYYWADNSVSATIKFSNEEAPDIKVALELFDTQLKAISFLKKEDQGYAQLPYEAITEKQYQDMVSKVRPGAIFASKISEESSGDKGSYCDGDKCIIK